MASRIAGITVEIDGDTTGLSKALSSINTDLKSTSSQLKDVEKLIKLDPTNTKLPLPDSYEVSMTDVYIL